MATVIFDIETIGEEWDALDETTQGVLSRWVERTAKNDEDREAQIRDLREGLGFSPLTGRIVAIGCYDLERAAGVVYYDNNSGDTAESAEGNIVLKPRDEQTMLADFWHGAESYDTFVTFNGRGFDAPFMAIRSAVHGITPSRDLLDGRYLYQQKLGYKHIDLADQLTFYGAVFRKQPLHLYCRAFGIESPKADGVSGDDVTALFKAGKYLDIARYNARDIIATAKLYEKWRDHLAPQNFKRGEFDY